MRGRGDRKTQKNRSEEKGVSFSSASLFFTRKREAVTRLEHGLRSLDAEDDPGSRYRQRLGGQARPLALSRYINVKQE